MLHEWRKTSSAGAGAGTAWILTSLPWLPTGISLLVVIGGANATLEEERADGPFPGDADVGSRDAGPDVEVAALEWGSPFECHDDSDYPVAVLVGLS